MLENAVYMAKRNTIIHPQQLDLFQLRAKYLNEIINNPCQNIDLGNLNMSQNVLVCNVKKDNVEHFLDGTAKLYYSGKRFPSTVALNKLYYFIPYIGKECDLDFSSSRTRTLAQTA